MKAINDGGTAFPCPVEFDPNQQLVSHGSFGMSLRDWFAGQALSSITVASDYSKGPCNQAMADRAYCIADAMLAARKGGEQ